jgi:hypothetical protein
MIFIKNCFNDSNYLFDIFNFIMIVFIFIKKLILLIIYLQQW